VISRKKITKSKKDLTISKKEIVNSKKRLGRKTFYYIFTGILFSFIIVGIVYWLTGFQFIILEPVVGDCKPIIENKGENKVDIVFFTDNVPESEIIGYIDFFRDTPGP